MAKYLEATLESVKFGNAKNKGTPQLVYTLKLVDTGETVTAYSYVTDKTEDRIIDELNFIGYPYDDFDHLNPDHPDYFDPDHKQVKVKMTEDEKYGPKYELVIRDNKPDVNKIKEANQVFAGMFAKRKAEGKGSIPAPPKKPLAPKSGGDEEKVPF